MSTWKGVEWAIWLHSFGDELTAQPKFWIDILVLFAWNVSCTPRVPSHSSARNIPHIRHTV